jgi:hypothetical protein
MTFMQYPFIFIYIYICMCNIFIHFNVCYSRIMGRHNKWLTDPSAVSYRIRNRSFRDARQLLIERSKRLEKKAARVARRQARAARQAEKEAALAAEQLQEGIYEIVRSMVSMCMVSSNVRF